MLSQHLVDSINCSITYELLELWIVYEVAYILIENHIICGAEG